jgi:outer membrane protein OmpA-like peptidoglycan-associated protein
MHRLLAIALIAAAPAARADSSVPGPHGKPAAAPSAPTPAARGPDSDGDGILDVDDLCPNDPEDRDGFEDDDGCPDPDNDHDRILDKDDKCPNEPETYNGFEDEDGCPDKGKVVVHESRGGIIPMVYFRDGEARIAAIHRPILDELLATVIGNPNITRVVVEGHTDSREAKRAADLGRRRAEAVAAYLREKGVARGRLVSEDHGALQPVDTNGTAAGRAKNRRVAFRIVGRSDEAPPASAPTRHP